jgi:hypothetical protein
MDRYRYRTKVFVGPWRASPHEAAEDAVRAGQAQRDAEGESVRWLVCGRIEISADPFTSFLPEGPPDDEDG